MTQEVTFNPIDGYGNGFLQSDFKLISAHHCKYSSSDQVVDRNEWGRGWLL